MKSERVCKYNPLFKDYLLNHLYNSTVKNPIPARNIVCAVVSPLITIPPRIIIKPTAINPGFIQSTPFIIGAV